MKKIVKYPLIGCASLLSIIVILALGGLVYWNHLMSAAGLKEDWNEKDGTIIENLAYGNLPDNNFDLYIPAKASKEIPQALMLFIHGGSWVGGDKGEEVFACRRYAKEGYFTATMSYTLAASNEKASIMSMLDEIQACITRIKEYTDSLGYHVERMATSGISAGGHLALLYALKCYDQSPIPVVFVAERVGPFDLTKLFDVPEDKIDEIARSLKEGKPSKNKDEIDALIYMTSGQKMTKHMYTKAIIDSLLLTASPVTYVTSRSVPGVFAYGAKDEIVAPVQAHLLQETYKKLNIPHSFFLFPNSNHFLGSDPEHTDQYIAEVKKYCKKYFGY